MRSAYLLLDLGAILPLFIASLYKWRGVGVDYQKYAKALAFVSVPFLIWDIFATHWQHWGFNPEYTTGLKIANLPIEEVLFFVAIPFVCVYAWEWVSKQKEKNVQYRWQHLALSAFLFLGVLVFFYGGGYSKIIAPLFLAIVIFLFVKKYFESTYFWTYQLVMFVLFLASCISLLGGIGLEVVEAKLLPLVPLVIALPALSTLTSDYASIVAARAADPAEQKKTKRQLAKAIVKSMWINIFGIVVMSLIISINRGYIVELEFLYKFVGFMAAAITTSILFLFIITVVLDYLFEHNKISQEDVFIPIITSLTNVAMLVFIALAAVLLF